MNRAVLAVLSGLIALAHAGCSPREVDTTYGRSTGSSINGTRAFAELLKADGHRVRVAFRFADIAASPADVLIRFAPRPGPPERAEGRWLSQWLGAEPGRKVVYVPHDFSAEPEFWAAVRAAQPEGAKPDVLARIELRQKAGQAWPDRLPKRPELLSRPEAWFGTIPPASPPTIARQLAGPWAEGVDAASAAITRHESLRADGDEEVLLEADGVPQVVTRSAEDGQILVIANASFLLNAALLDRPRRLLAARVVGWVGPEPRQVAFLEGDDLSKPSPPGAGSPLALLGVEPFGWVAAHLGAFGLLACLAMGATLGRPRPRANSEIQRPSSHPEALGALLARTGRADVALDLLETYRRWRHPGSTQPGPGTPLPPSTQAPRP